MVTEPQKPAVSKPAKPSKTPEQIAEQLAKQQQLKLEQELATIENDERLNLLLDRLDDGQSVSADDEAWLDAKLARHQELLAELGIEDEDDDDQPASPKICCNVSSTMISIPVRSIPSSSAARSKRHRLAGAYDEQYDVGRRIEKDDLLPGDLVFYSTDGPGATFAVFTAEMVNSFMPVIKMA